MPFIFYKPSFRLLKFYLSLLFMGCCFWSAAQETLSTEEIIDHVLSEHPELQKLSLEIQKLELGRTADHLPSPVEIGYQGGEINFAGYDHVLSLDQNISHLFGRKASKQVYRDEIAELIQEQKIIANEVTFEIKKILDELSFEKAQISLLDSLLHSYEMILSEARQRHDSDHESSLEEDLLQAHYLQYKRRAMKLKSEFRESRIDFDELTQLPEGKSFNISILEKVNVSHKNSENPSSLLLDAFHLKEKTLKSRFKAESVAQRKPDISLGYFIQSLEHDFGFQGISVGIGVPLYGKSSTAIEKQEQIEYELLQIEKDDALGSFTSKLQKLTRLKGDLEKMIEQHEQDDLPFYALMESKQSLSGVEALGENVKMLEVIFNGKMDYMDTISEYNRICLELAYLTQVI